MVEDVPVSILGAYELILEHAELGPVLYQEEALDDFLLPDNGDSGYPPCRPRFGAVGQDHCLFNRDCAALEYLFHAGLKVVGVDKSVDSIIPGFMDVEKVGGGGIEESNLSVHIIGDRRCWKVSGDGP